LDQDGKGSIQVSEFIAIVNSFAQMWSAALGQPSKYFLTKSGYRPKVDSKHFPTAVFGQNFIQ